MNKVLIGWLSLILCGLILGCASGQLETRYFTLTAPGQRIIESNRLDEREELASYFAKYGIMFPDGAGVQREQPSRLKSTNTKLQNRFIKMMISHLNQKRTPPMGDFDY